MSEDAYVPAGIVQKVDEIAIGGEPEDTWHANIFKAVEKASLSLTGVVVPIVHYGPDDHRSGASLNVNLPFTKQYGDPGLTVRLVYPDVLSDSDVVVAEIGQFSKIYGLGPKDENEYLLPVKTSGLRIDRSDLLTGLYGASLFYGKDLSEDTRLILESFVGASKAENSSIGYTMRLQHDLTEDFRVYAYGDYVKNAETSLLLVGLDEVHVAERIEYGLYAQNDLMDGATQITYGVEHIERDGDINAYIKRYNVFDDAGTYKDSSTRYQVTVRQRLTEKLDAVFTALANDKGHRELSAGVGYEIDDDFVIGVQAQRSRFEKTVHANFEQDIPQETTVSLYFDHAFD